MPTPSYPRIKQVVAFREELQDFQVAYDRLVAKLTQVEAEPADETHHDSNSVCLPAALRGRWANTVDQNKALPDAELKSKASRSSLFDFYRTDSSNSAKGSAAQIDGLWRDLYTASESISEEQEGLLGRRSAPRRISTSSQSSISTLSMSEEAWQAGVSSLFSFRCVLLHPDGKFRIAWDAIGGLLVVWDCITIPMNAAWSFDMQTSNPEFVLFMFAMLYWTLDFALNFRTGIYEEGHLILQPRRIALRYLQGWLLFDCAVVSLDYLVLLLVGMLNSSNIFRVIRLLRMGRTLRVGKMLSASNLGRKLHDMGAGSGMVGVVIALTIAKLLFSIFMIAHLLACCWYYIGISSFEVSPEESWLSLEDEFSKQFVQIPSFVQYTRSLHWVLALMTTNTNDSIIHPLNDVERVFSICTIFSSILILGSSASNLASDLSALNRMNAEIDDTRNKLQRHLRASKVPSALRERILKFALHALRRRTAMVLDTSTMSLLSDQLQSELVVCQRKEHVQIHPLFRLISSSHPEALLSVCNAFKLHLYSVKDTLFSEGARARQLYVTRSGRYRLLNSGSILAASASSAETNARSHKSTWEKSLAPEAVAESLDFEEPYWFAELSLFCEFMHQCTLEASSFGDAFTLTAPDFASSISHFPACVVDVFRYAEAYLSKIWIGAAPPSGYVLGKDVMPPDAALNACKEVESLMQRVRLWDLPACPQPDDNVRQDVLSAMMTRGMSNDELEEKLPMAFTELREDKGSYSILELPDARKRALTAIMCARWLCIGDYESFTEVQPEASRMSRKLWAGWQEVVLWTLQDQCTMHAMIVFLTIKDIGKAKAMSSAMHGALKGTPEDNVVYYLTVASEEKSLVPAFFNLSTDMQELVKSALVMHSQFNLGQMLQAENNPSHLAMLQNIVFGDEAEGQSLLKFYFLNLVCMMSALRGSETQNGSLFLDQENGSNMLIAINCLQQLTGATPQAVYWSFIQKRARSIGLSCRSQEELAAARLACLTRTSATDCGALLAAWTALHGADRRILAEFLLADGIQEPAYMLTFLPLYFVNSKLNKSVGLQAALIVLVDLLEMLKAAGCNKPNDGENATLRVDISEIATYAKEVKAPRAFEAIPAYTKLEEMREGMKLVINSRHWQRVRAQVWQQEPHEMYFSMRKIERSILE